VRVDAHGRIDGFVAVGQPDAGFEIRRTFARADDHHPLDARCLGALEDGLTVGIELGVI